MKIDPRIVTRRLLDAALWRLMPRLIAAASRRAAGQRKQRKTTRP